MKPKAEREQMVWRLVRATAWRLREVQCLAGAPSERQRYDYDRCPRVRELVEDHLRRGTPPQRIPTLVTLEY